MIAGRQRKEADKEDTSGNPVHLKEKNGQGKHYASADRESHSLPDRFSIIHVVVENVKQCASLRQSVASIVTARMAERLGPVDSHVAVTTPAAGWIPAAKPASVLS